MIKIRLQGTLSDIQWFHHILDGIEEIEVTEFSRPFTNKGTTRFYRAYAEAVKANQEGKEEEKWGRL